MLSERAAGEVSSKTGARTLCRQGFILGEEAGRPYTTAAFSLAQGRGVWGEIGRKKRAGVGGTEPGCRRRSRI